MMTVTFLIPSYLRAFTGGWGRVELASSASTVAEALGELWEKHPGLRDRVLTEQGAVRQHVNIFVGEENIRDAGGLSTPVSAGCEIMIVPNVAGG
ncbi:MAG: MoaD/ThiS family protein [Acidobacteria bacterium]|nr:MoaD/ThiS family protein [Acidobacteriota bacterium]